MLLTEYCMVLLALVYLHYTKKGRNLSILREPLDGASSNRLPAYMFGATNGVETYQTGTSICSKKLSRFSLKDELPFALGISLPSSTTKIENYLG